MVAGEEEGFAGEGEELGFAGGAAGVEDGRDLPVMIRAGRDKMPVHRPVVILAERESVGRVVVVTIGKRDEMSGVDEGDVVGFRQADP